jgi:hypothetical protein
MNKLFLLLFLTLSFIVSCSSCLKKEDQSDAGVVTPPPPIVRPTLISRDNWQLTLPEGWTENHTALPGTVLLARSEDNKMLVLLHKEMFLGTTQELTALYVRDIHDQGAELISTSSMEINGIKYALLEAAKPTTKAWMWETALNKYGYSLLCAGAASDYSTCLTIARSIVIR